MTDSEKRPPRIDEVARIAGVSPITVSRALRQPEKVAEEKRRRIQAAIEQTGYAPNQDAIRLRSGGRPGAALAAAAPSTLVAAFVSNIANPQFSRAVRACAEVLEPAGYRLMMGETAYSYARETAMIRSLRDLRPAAVMFTGVIELEENREALRALGVPVMETWAYPQDPIDMLVGFSNFDGGRLVGEHFGERGYRRVAYVGRGGGRGVLRLQGFKEGLAKHGLRPAAELPVEGPAGLAEGRRAMAALLDQGEPLDAAFFGNDLLAIGAMFEARRRGMAVPGDLAVAGFGDIELSEALEPGLTTVRIDSDDIGRRAGRMLLTRLGGERPERGIELVELSLVVRASG
ncbi:substrate-binding domain-containing protein [Inquilinus sp. Marseille-Q2685]|uniref:substrate-binding domain-containing protein n=1 Tax=Inquilinus sp. Marseille-Q2685 TaxID=2866581 RepID=UPI001CE3C556|nr:substrate-binding domain-containing protein [Inquilinus sp. Marseille-Q2685]